MKALFCYTLYSPITALLCWGLWYSNNNNIALKTFLIY